MVLTIGSLNQGIHQTTQKDTWLAGNFISSNTAINWAATAGNYIDITQLQLEEGNLATKYEYITNDVQLFRCQRYYEKWTTHFTTHNLAGTAGGTVYFKTTKVRPATVTLATANTGSAVAIPTAIDNSANGLGEFFIFNNAPVSGTNNSFHFTGYAESELFHF